MANFEIDKTIRIAWILQFSIKGVDYYRWSGIGDLDFNTHTYTGTSDQVGHIMEVSNNDNVLGNVGKRFNIRLGVTTDGTRRLLNQYLGSIPVSVGWIYKIDPEKQASQWIAMPLTTKGRLSTVSINNGICTFEVETYSGDIQNIDAIIWTNEAQQLRYPGDKGLEFAEQVANGVDLRWPP